MSATFTPTTVAMPVANANSTSAFHLLQRLAAGEEDAARLLPMLAHLERLATLGTVAVSTAHELNNPLSVVITTCHALLGHLKDETMTPEQLTDYVGLIEENAWRCTRMVQSLQRYGRQAPPRPAHLDVRNLIEDAVSLIQHELEGRDIVLHLALPAGLPFVRWDPAQITQVLVNLLLNARDALPRTGGEIAVRTWSLPAEDAVALAVTDSGAGVPPELQGKIFEPFFTTKPAGQGTGLGLSIALGIVHQHEGRIEVDNEPAGGATFTVVLPRRPPLDELDDLEAESRVR